MSQSNWLVAKKIEIEIGRDLIYLIGEVNYRR
jgi:hypothetical protein